MAQPDFEKIVKRLNSKFIDSTKPNIAGSRQPVGSLKGKPFSGGRGVCNGVHYLKENFFEFAPSVEARPSGFYLTWTVYDDNGAELFKSVPIGMNGITAASDAMLRIEEMVSAGIGEAMVVLEEHKKLGG